MTKPLALAYVRVSSLMQVEEGASLDAQEATLREEATRRGWAVEIVREEGKSAKSLRGRDKLTGALERLDRGEAQFLLSVRLDRVSRSVADFASLIDRARRKHWGIVLLSPNLDLSDPSGEFVANVLASAAQYERRLISVRTREGMAQRKAEGVTFGREVASDFLPTYERVLTMHGAGESLNAIARTLNQEGVPTAKGGQWYPSTVRAMVTSQTAKALSQ
ncbi:recombinase family protein [Microbacterium sp. NPDC087589]|uniref:recombinase family protein n=1 Tax=Microbacterium sp. NPDC087589 TaxID=3364191 RepID=UPI0038280205